LTQKNVAYDKLHVGGPLKHTGVLKTDSVEEKVEKTKNSRGTEKNVNTQKDIANNNNPA
jgi:hypothetical protein